MDVSGGKSSDFYGILGLKKECSEAEIKYAYRKLAMRWHPDRCLASGDSKNVEEANKKFQALQEAYSVLSDANRRFLYDVGVHDNDDDNDEKGMADFLSEMATMMRQNKSNENNETSFEELKDLFEEMFENDIKSFGSSSETKSFTPCPAFVSRYDENTSSTNKRGSSAMSAITMVEDHSSFTLSVDGFCLGTNNMADTKRGVCARERRGTKHMSKHKSSQNGVSSVRD